MFARARLLARGTAAAAGCATLGAWWHQRQSLCQASPPSLEGKVALVTGGTGSIGWAVAQQLADAGCRVALVDLDEKRCSEMAAKLPTKCIGLAFDVSKFPKLKALHATMKAEPALASYFASDMYAKWAVNNPMATHFTGNAYTKAYTAFGPTLEEVITP